MNARISRKFSFPAGIHYDGSFIINTYDIELFLDVTTEDIREQNIAMDRIKYLFDVCLDSCIFVDMHDCKAVDSYAKTNINICLLPDEPYDQVIASVLISKINSITEKHLFVTEIKVKSRICDDVIFYVGENEEADFHGMRNVWWTENSPMISTLKKSKKEKVVELKKEPKDWNSIGLGWKQETHCDKGEIVFIPVDK